MSEPAEEIPYWTDGLQTGCPFLRFVPWYGRAGIWLSLLVEPPCRLRVCGQFQCHNFGEPFKGKEDRFAVVAR